MKNKSKKVREFMDGLFKFIVDNPQFRWKTNKKSEPEIQTEIRPLIIQYLMLYFQQQGVKDFVRKANSAFYWEGQEGQYEKDRTPVFGSKNYPDFIIQEPYKIAFEYKQAETGSMVKTGIGQSIVHTLSGDYDYVMYLYHDENKDQKTVKSVIDGSREQGIIDLIWDQFNIYLKVI